MKVVNHDFVRESISQSNVVFNYQHYRKIVLPLTDMKVVLDFDEILFVESVSNYSKIKTYTKTYMISKTLKWVLSKLDHQFIRTHNSYVINLKEVKFISTKNQIVTLTNGKEIPISRSRKKDLTSFFDS